MLFTTLLDDAEFLAKNPRLFSDVEDAIQDSDPNDGGEVEVNKILAELLVFEKGGREIEEKLREYVEAAKTLANKHGVFINEKRKISPVL